jgi:secondary thiamine-phosphate synthase enzyme
MPSIISVATAARGFSDITTQVQHVITKHRMRNGLVNVFIQHTSASLVIFENADPSAKVDLENWMHRLTSDYQGIFTHDAEGPDDMPAHLRSILTNTSISIPVQSGRLTLGTWQGIYVWEHRNSPHTRKVVITCISESEDRRSD